MSTLDDWTQALCAELGLDQEEGIQKTVLNLARVAAHTVDRPAAPLTAYFLGVAVGRGEHIDVLPIPGAPLTGWAGMAAHSGRAVSAGSCAARG